MNGIGRRVAIVEGCRTPFAKANTAFRELSAVDMGKVAVRELMPRQRASYDAAEREGTWRHAFTPRCPS